MRFHTKQHKYYCGVDLHARVMHLCIFNASGETVLQRSVQDRQRPLTTGGLPTSPAFPITRPTPTVRNGNNLNNVVDKAVHEQKRESLEYVAARAVQILRPPFRRFDDRSDCSIQFFKKLDRGAKAPLRIPIACLLGLTNGVRVEPMRWS